MEADRMAEASTRSVAPRDGAVPLASDVPHLLLDQPSEHPELGFPETARALGDIIASSSPRFAVGIFGRWGSGKSTLAQAIARRLDEVDKGHERVIPVEFNAWRYEREEHLIIPLLDTLRDALAEWAEGHKGDKDEVQARKVASTIGRAIRSIVAGLSVSIGVPGAIGLSWEANKALEEARQPGEDDEAAVPHSFYHASFRALRGALASFVGADRRIVVFVDDLDRCLPDRALQVLESMKLFFDMEGFVFVVGLDQAVVDYALWAKFHQPIPSAVLAEPAVPMPGAEPAVDSPASSASPAAPSGEDYVKKVFQLEYRIAPVRYEDLDTFLEAAVRDSALPDEQASDIRGRVLRHLQVMVGDAPVNPREVKRYVNEYTLLMTANPALDPDVVLCLSTLQRRPDWRVVHEALLEWGDAFVDALRARAEGHERALENLDPALERPPDDFLDYISGGPAASLLDAALGSLDPYVRSGEALRSDLSPELLAAVRRFGEVRGAFREAVDKASIEPLQGQIGSKLERVQSTVVEYGAGPLRDALTADLAKTTETVKALTAPQSSDQAPDEAIDDLRATLNALEAQGRDIAKRLLRLYRMGHRGVERRVV
jgi:KAP family P-loop domain